MSLKWFHSRNIFQHFPMQVLTLIRFPLSLCTGWIGKSNVSNCRPFNSNQSMCASSWRTWPASENSEWGAKKIHATSTANRKSHLWHLAYATRTIANSSVYVSVCCTWFIAYILKGCCCRPTNIILNRSSSLLPRSHEGLGDAHVRRGCSQSIRGAGTMCTRNCRVHSRRPGRTASFGDTASMRWSGWPILVACSFCLGDGAHIFRFSTLVINNARIANDAAIDWICLCYLALGSGTFRRDADQSWWNEVSFLSVRCASARPDNRNRKQI